MRLKTQEVRCAGCVDASEAAAAQQQSSCHLWVRAELWACWDCWEVSTPVSRAERTGHTTANQLPAFTSLLEGVKVARYTFFWNISSYNLFNMCALEKDTGGGLKRVRFAVCTACSLCGLGIGWCTALWYYDVCVICFFVHRWEAGIPYKISLQLT